MLQFKINKIQVGLQRVLTSSEYNQAVEFVVQTRKASISSVQRRLKIGYNRAARLIEEMESTGIIGPLDGGFRDVLIAATPQD